MFVVRIIAGLLLLLAAIALVSDLTRASAAGGMAMTSLAVHWRQLSPQSLMTVANAVKGNLHPLVWDLVLWRLLLLPAWLSLGALGCLFALLGRRQRRVNIFIN